jgi:hypothetical protein
MNRVLPLLLLAAAALPAQYAISAMAGYIHHTEGEVWLGDRAIAPKATDFEHVLEGRRLRTGKGRAEILLVPGSFVRLGESSEIEMVSSGLTSATLRLVSGAMVVDLQTLYEKDSIGIEVGEREVRFRKTGLYRIDAASLTVRVLDGRARVTGPAGEEVDLKGGQELALGDAASHKLAEAPNDLLDAWNSERHEQLTVLAERVRKERWDNMDAAERDLLRMILSRPTSQPSSNRPAASPPASNGWPAQR